MKRAAGVLILAVALLGDGRRAAAEDYRLGAEDRLRIAVYEYPNLDGEYVVGASGAVALPLLGELRAEGRTPSQLSADISGRLTVAIRSTAPVSATVEVVEYRPFFILGDVEKPGRYAYQPGLRMLQALALAGGVYRLADVGLLRVTRDAIAAEGEIRVLEGRERDLVVERQRLEAEMRGDDVPAFAAGSGERDREAMQRQRAVFETRRAALARQSGTLNELIASLREELDALDLQGAFKARQVGTVEEELAATRELVGKGLTPKARGLELERLQADIESDRQEVATEKLRVRQAISRTEQSLYGLTDGRRAEVAAALEQVSRGLAETRAELETQRELLAEASAAAPGLRWLAGEAPPLVYSVARFGETATRTFAATEAEAVAPGDVITVRVGVPAGSSGEAQRADAGR